MGVTRIQTTHGIKYRARITIDGQRHNLGMHRTQHEAFEAINSFLERCGIPYEETAARQRQKEREQRRKREEMTVTMSKTDHGALHKAAVVDNAVYVKRIDLANKPLIRRLLARLKR